MKATLTVLGSGTSMGVPTIGCDCAVCRSADPRDRRTRPSIMVQWEDQHPHAPATDPPGVSTRTVLIDPTPDFRYQAIREGIRKIDAVLYTHGHADHILGLDDVRPLTFWSGDIPLYADAPTLARLTEIFGYIFSGEYRFGGSSTLKLNELDGVL